MDSNYPYGNFRNSPKDLPGYYEGIGSKSANGGTSHPKSPSPDPNLSSPHQDLRRFVGKDVILGNCYYRIKDYHECAGQQLFAMESYREMNEFDGRCPQCRQEIINLPYRRGYYAEVRHIVRAIENESHRKRRENGPLRLEDLSSVVQYQKPLNQPLLGKETGIEGDSNSCYIDATLFCMFAYTDRFDRFLTFKVSQKFEPLQKILRDYIVYPLRDRRHGLVSRDVIYHLRQELVQLMKDRSFNEHEKDPSDFLRVFESLFDYTPIQTIQANAKPDEHLSNVTRNIIWEMFDANPTQQPHTNIGQLFRNSLTEIPARLLSIPPVMILVAPRHSRVSRSYKYIIPDREIVFDHDILQIMCAGCNNPNSRNNSSNRDYFSCPQCALNLNVPVGSVDDARVIGFCSGCAKSMHTSLPESVRTQHDVAKIPINKHRLTLFAVLCIELAHYVAFVKCQRSQNESEWLFFDSMSDRIGNDKNIPCVSRVPDFDRWLDEAKNNTNTFVELDRKVKDPAPTSRKFNEQELRRLRLFRDGAFFFYENPTHDY